MAKRENCVSHLVKSGGKIQAMIKILMIFGDAAYMTRVLKFGI